MLKLILHGDLLRVKMQCKSADDSAVQMGEEKDDEGRI